MSDVREVGTLIGNVIDGTYRVERLIGEGGSGVVYECSELNLPRQVAVKMLKPSVTGDRDLQRLLAEARNLACLNHPNVVHVLRMGEHEGKTYIAMEFVKGRTLREVVKADHPELHRVLEIMRQSASGLAAIHASGIVHRDLSTNNIMVAENGTAKILDLGLSKDFQRQSTTDTRGYLVGTLHYVSPEQINGRVSGFEADIFSFGVILYEALTGVHPFHAEHDMSLLYNISQRPPEPLPTHLPDCPERLTRLVDSCLEKHPENRPPGMTHVERELDEIIRGLPFVGTPSPRPLPRLRPARPTPRNPYLNRVMIRHREDFFGRAQEIRRIYARLNATPPGSMSVVGDRKIGKSSLLNYVYGRASRNEYLEQPDRTVMVFLDFQQEKNMTVESFVRELLVKAKLELRDRLDVSDCALSLDGTRDMVHRLDSAGYRLTILLDEFEAVTTNANFHLEFFSFLRFLANHYNVSYITSSSRDLQVLCHNKEISDSPFFNIFSTVRLSVFQRPEAEELIRTPSERIGRALGAYVGPILEMAGLFPFFIQMACAHAVDYLDEHPDKPPDFREIRRGFYEEAKLHFRFIWDGFDRHERSTMLRVARGKGLPDALKHVLAELESRHYVEQDRGHAHLFASTFDEFVRDEARRGEPGLLSRILGAVARGNAESRGPTT